MKVWANYRNGGYSGGMILVAANSAEEAHKAFRESKEYAVLSWSEVYNGVNGDDYYHADKWEQIPILEAHVDKPQVLAEAGYIE